MLRRESNSIPAQDTIFLYGGPADLCCEPNNNTFGLGQGPVLDFKRVSLQLIFEFIEDRGKFLSKVELDGIPIYTVC